MLWCGPEYPIDKVPTVPTFGDAASKLKMSSLIVALGAIVS